MNFGKGIANRRPISNRELPKRRGLANLTMIKPAPARWTIVFDPTGLKAADVRMLTAVIDADLSLMRLAADPSDALGEDELVVNVARALAARFPDVTFRVVELD
jgi:hypothetical protein